MNWFDRTELLLGKDNLEALFSKNVLVAGLGGVGAFAAEMLVRAGIGKMTIFDGDLIELTNLNRQLPATTLTLGKRKAKLAGDKLRAINPELDLTIIDRFLEDTEMPALFDVKFDYIIDAIDTLAPKIALIENAVRSNVPIVSSMGSGGKTDPFDVRVEDIQYSYNCRLAKYLRKNLHRKGIYSGVKVVFSPEQINKQAVRLEESRNKKSVVGTISYMPPLFAIYAVYTVINDLLELNRHAQKPELQNLEILTN